VNRFEASDLGKLLSSIESAGYRLVGPRVYNQAVVYDEIRGLNDLPRGWTDEQGPGFYRIKKTDSRAYFGYSSSPRTWKESLFKSRERLFSSTKTKNGSIQFTREPVEAPKVAFIGVRACDVVAIAIQDRIFIEPRIQDPAYQARRENALIVAVQCTSSSPTCFCASMNTGPEVRGGYDLALTEIVSEREHYFLIQENSAEGERVLALFERSGHLNDGIEEYRACARPVFEEVARTQKRRMDLTGVRKLLNNNFEHPRWENVAARCLNCTNCTLVCPTCFCATVEDTADLGNSTAERWRRWDSCFTLDHSYIHGGSVRYTGKSRYRQWMTHKLSTWWDQFGTTGCVGCGRCITWCPVGIDITEEAEAIAKNENN